ncbi:DMT family transporter [Streptomyces anulatus]|uniref:DMT family transporter n=1 Tax=Streptomyces anulatus TaxID=1892 RepID=UPI00364F99F1|nr:DMT family transporter [Streptomyces anulatus]
MLCALTSAICYGTASVLQAVATRSAGPGTGSGLDPALLSRSLRQWRYLVGLCLDGIGFLLQIVALRSIPLYAVGSALAASLAVTAIASVRLFGIRLSRTEWGAVTAVSAGLAMISLASGPRADLAPPAALGWSLLAMVLVVLLSGALLGRLPGRPRALLLGLGAGLGFGAVEVAVRLIDSLAVPGILIGPALYALLVGGATGFLFLTSAFQRGSVTVATAGMVLGETIGPALVGVVWLGDRPREGLSWLAFAGCAVAVAGALALARFGEPPVEATGRKGWESRTGS